MREARSGRVPHAGPCSEDARRSSRGVVPLFFRVTALIACTVASVACVAHARSSTAQRRDPPIAITFDSARSLVAVAGISARDTVRRIVERVLEVGGVARGYHGDTLVVDAEYLTIIESLSSIGERATRMSATSADIVLVFIPDDPGVRLRYVTQSSSTGHKVFAAGFVLAIVVGTLWYASRARW